MSGAVAGLPLDVVRVYEHWKDIVRLSGPPGLSRIRGFRDSPTEGRNRRASRLGRGYCVVYRVRRADVLVLAILPDLTLPARDPGR